MKATIRDAASLSALRPLEMVSYLRSGGWRQESESTGKWSIWTQKAGQSEFEVVVPLSAQYRDFALRMSDAIQSIEAFEQRPQLEILRDLLVTSADLIRVRLKDGELADGTIPLEEGARFFDEAKEMMLAAACAAVSARTYFPSKRPTQATDYLRKTRLGQTEHGSFVLTVISRVPPSLSVQNGALFEKEEPFERRVTQTLATGLAAVRAAAEAAASSGSVSSFVDAVKFGVNANLCDALVGMGAVSSRSLQIDLSWSRSRPLDPQHPVPSSVVFSPDVFPVIAEAAAYLKESTPREEFEARGPVVKLDRPGGAPTGKITIHCFVDGQPRKVTVELDDLTYHEAVRAHDEQLLVRCSGVLLREGRSLRLHEPYGFVVEPDE